MAVEIYVTETCPYCVRAKALFDKKDIPYTLIDVSHSDELRKTMEDRSDGRKTVPQIFIHGRHAGGCDDVYTLEKEGLLDNWLKE